MSKPDASREQEAQPANPVGLMYLQLTDAMGYTSGKDGLEFSPEEWAESLLKDALAFRAAQPAAQELEALRFATTLIDSTDPRRKIIDKALATALAREQEAQPPTREEAAQELLDAANAFWTSERKAAQPGAVKWLTGDDGALVIFTRGEYRDTLLRNIDEVGCKEHSFTHPPTASEREGDAYRVFLDGNQWCAVGHDFVNIQESLCAFNDTPYRALELLTEAEAEAKRRAQRRAQRLGREKGEQS